MKNEKNEKKGTRRISSCRNISKIKRWNWRTL